MATRPDVLALAFVLALGCRASSGKTARNAARTPEEVRRDGNHLVGAGSAYLRQHAHNPVDWYSWGPEALALAVKLDRPIFLSIGYVSCHWCHVMEREVFEHDDVAAFLNEHFISIKVDREERPDLDAVYMNAVEAMTGSGGWPMTVFLTPSLRPFFGGTYLPRERFLQAIRSAAEEFRTDRNAVENHGAEVGAQIAAAEPKGAQATLGSAELRAVARDALRNVDATWGGFRGKAKFPTPIKWKFLLDAYRKWQDPEIAQSLRRTLDAMSAGGIHDHVGGGFFRYSTEPTWTVPHFEKMLYDNAQLAALYLDAAAAFDEPRYRAVGLDILDFILKDMSTESHAFGASFDADAAGKEGSTYLWTPAELASVLGDADGRAVALIFNATASGNFDGSNVLRLGPNDGARDPDSQLWQRCRPKLIEARIRRAQPAFDAKMVTAWNGLAIGALALGYRVSGESRFREGAERAAEAIWRMNHLPNGELSRTADGARVGTSAVLTDYAFLADGLVELFQATSKPLYLEQAVALVTQAMNRFSSPDGGWFLTSGSDQEPLGRQIERSDGVEPSGGAAMILVLVKLAALAGRDDFSAAAELALRRYADTIRQRGIDMAGWLDGALMIDGPFYDVVIAGPGGTLTNAWNGLLPGWAVGVQLGAAGPSPELERVMPNAAGKHDSNGTALGYVCIRGSCQKPTADPTVLRSQLLAGWIR